MSTTGLAFCANDGRTPPASVSAVPARNVRRLNISIPLAPTIRSAGRSAGAWPAIYPYREPSGNAALTHPAPRRGPCAPRKMASRVAPTSMQFRPIFRRLYRITNAKNRTRQESYKERHHEIPRAWKRLPRVCDRAWMLGHERGLRRARRRGVDRNHSSRRRARHHAPRHVGCLCRRRQRTAGGQGGQRSARYIFHRLEIRKHPWSGWSARRRQRQARLRSGGLRGEPQAARRRSHRSLLRAPHRSERADRRHRRRDVAADRAGQGPLSRPLRGWRQHASPRAQDASADRAADRIFAVDPRHRSRDLSDTA